MANWLRLFGALFLAGLVPGSIHASKLVEVTPLDKEYLMLHFLDGEVTSRDDGSGKNAFLNSGHEDNIDTVKNYGTPLVTAEAASAANWVISSATDAGYAAAGKNPLKCHRKSKLNGMAEREWVSSDFRYEYTMEHYLFLQLPAPLVQGSAYTLSIGTPVGSDKSSVDFTFDIFKNRSEALHVNLSGYTASSTLKAADLYFWMGDGGARDYKAFEGNEVYLYNVTSATHQKAGTVAFWKKSAGEAQGYNLTGSSVWNIDITGTVAPGTYRIAVDGVGCSQDFTVGDDVYYDPFKVSVLGFFYMRIGQDSTGRIRPVPRRPLYLPGKDPATTKVYITTMHPYHAQWKTFASGDVWDAPASWATFRTAGNPVNANAWGGHSDALDWDRHLGHVAIIYDMLLPFILTKGAISDDDLGIAESGNGIPDILDEARYEVDFWLRVRDGKGYSHGVTNPDDKNVMYQAGTTAIAAWANALNCAMLADCFRLAGKTSLMNEYRDSAAAAFSFANALPAADQMLTSTHGIGDQTITGKDLKMSAAAFLYNVTGEQSYEDVVKSGSVATGTTSDLANAGSFNQIYGTAGYLLTPQAVNNPDLFAKMKASVIYQAKNKEANFSASRPSRRANDDATGYFQTEQNVQRTMVAHAVCDNAADKELFSRAMAFEADWGLGRNPLNIIQMTTASTSLASKRSIEKAYTTGFNDGTPGMHPGHTPYMNLDDWACSMVMGCPSWLHKKGYPANFTGWPMAEAYFNTRYVWAHSEFTPQQTMRGKTALYGYLYGIGTHHSGTVSHFGERPDAQHSRRVIFNGNGGISITGGIACRVRLLDLSGRVLWATEQITGTTIPLPAGVRKRRGCTVIEIVAANGAVSRQPVLFIR